MTKIILNGQEIEVDGKQPLIRACHDHGVDVPMYCYHPGLTPVGSCRICQVSVKEGERPPRVAAACRTPVSEGMIVDTNSEGAHDARRECLEFLLKNHPLDCPICDKAGECDLQDYSFAEGQAQSRSSEPRQRKQKRKSLGDTILLDQERCVLCSRCVRFFDDVTHKPQLTVAGLGSHSVIDTFMSQPLTGNYQGNIADICPVGALTLKKFRFKARVWNLSKTRSTCSECSRGCAITVEILRKREVARMRPRYDPEVNDWWMCDTGRFAMGTLNDAPPADGEVLGGRLHGAALRGYSALETCSTDRALDHAADMLATHPERVLIGSPFMTVEEGHAALALATTLGAKACFVSPAANDLADDLLHTGDPCPNRRGLTDLGFEALTPEAALAALAGTQASVLCGERVVETVGLEPLRTLPASLRLVVLDTHAQDIDAADVFIGVPTRVEKVGHWINIDGHRGELGQAKAPPAGVELLERSLARLTEALAGSTEVAAR